MKKNGTGSSSSRKTRQHAQRRGAITAVVSDVAGVAERRHRGPRRSRSLAVVNAEAVADILPMREALEVVTAAMLELSDGLVDAPERWAMSVAPAGMMGLMPGSMTQIGRFGIKVISLFANAAEHGLSGHQGVMVLFDSATGRPLCVIEGGALTGLRTAAASAVATRALARADARCVALIGCGEQARWHVEAIALVRPIEEIRVWGRSLEQAKRFVAQHQRPNGIQFVVAESVREAIQGAGIICTLTHAEEPVIAGAWLEKGQHLNLVGSSTRSSREVDDASVVAGRFIVDSRANALSQAGELRHAMAEGLVRADHVVAEIGDVLAGRVIGRPDASTITIYKSLGHVVQDIRIAHALQGRLGDSSRVVEVEW